MSKKIARNSICPCGSGLKYKYCCGKSEGLRSSNMRFIGDTKSSYTEFDKYVFEKLGYYPNDYINSINKISDVVYVLIDESNIGDFYAIGAVVILKSEIIRNKKVKSDLIELVDRYNIDYIHFTEIFGRKKILGEKKKAFVKEYVDIIKGLNMNPFSVCMSKSDIESWLKLDHITKEQCYVALTWKMMFNVLVYLIYKYGKDLIIEMWRENENITAEKRILHQENIRGLIGEFPFANISIYRHYILFQKKEILFSSLADFIAYLTIGLYPKFRTEFSANDLANDYYDLLVVYNQIFDDTIGMRSETLDQLLAIVGERERYRFGREINYK